MIVPFQISTPHKRNFCGGNFADWLEVNLTDKCNGSCAWCVEKRGWHPSYHAPWHVIANAAVSTGKTNIILLGGEPTLYRDLRPLIRYLVRAGRRVWITTNGSTLSEKFVDETLPGVFGVNVSIHDSSLSANRRIVGVPLDCVTLREAISALHKHGATVRFNCNCIAGHIDSQKRILEYIHFAKRLGADRVRFAELKFDDDRFVDLAAICNHEYGLNDDPFHQGCNNDTMIDGMPVNLRQMCGLNTSQRPAPVNPQGAGKKVLYYDGKVYDGWQTEQRATIMEKTELLRILAEVAEGSMAIEEAARRIKQDADDKESAPSTTAEGGFCKY